MNVSKSISLLKNIDLGIENNKNLLNGIDVELTSIGNDLAGIGATQLQHTSYLSSTSTNTLSSKNSLTNIESDVSDLNRKKIIFKARLTDGTNEYLSRADYSSSPIDFYWQNDKGVPVYVLKYQFTYNDGTEPTAQELYHSTAFDSNIGAMNEAGDDYEAPYITIKDNCDYFFNSQPNSNKQTWVNPQALVYQNDFDYAPIEIGVSRKFGHHISANINTGEYDSDPIGIIEGYYYAS